MVEREFGQNHPLKVLLEYYCDNNISDDKFKIIMREYEHKMNLSWLTSGYAILYEFLMSGEGLKLLSTIQNEIGVA